MILTVKYIADELTRIGKISGNYAKIDELALLKRKCRADIRQIGMMYTSIEDIISHLTKMVISDEEDTRWQRWDVKMEFDKMANHIHHIAHRLGQE